MSYRTYRKKVDRITRYNMTEDEKNSKLTVDHLFPIRKGYDLNIPPEVIADRRNLQMIPLMENIVKSDDIDYIPQFIQQWLLGNINDIKKVDVKKKQREGIEKAKKKGVYRGRVKGSNETTEQFLNKPKNKEVIELMEKGVRHNEIQRITGISQGTITKIKKLLVR
jgi:DNA invertase Pin-like site-specific DNA recombinase